MNRVVDLVIPTYKPDGRFDELLKRLKKQSYPIRNIYIMNTKSQGFTEELENIPGTMITQIEPNEFDHGATRDAGLRLSNADIVVFMTQDAIPANDMLIKELIKPLLSDDKVVVAYGKQLPTQECDVVEQYTRSFNYPNVSRIKSKEDIEQLGIKTFFCSNVCAAYKRENYLAIGGFTKKTIFNEDMIFAGHAIYGGYKVAYVAEAQVIHSHNYSGVQQFQRNFDLAVSQTDHPEVFEGVSSESEGIKLVKKTSMYLLKRKKIHWIPVFIYKSGCKYIGYKLGRRYKYLPLFLIKLCTMNRRYWNM